MVRTRTDGRRQAIIDVAIEAFRDVGFERTTMALISARVGGSKSTIYSYFTSKEELFEAAMRAACEAPGDLIMDLLAISSTNPRATLEAFAIAYLNFVLGEQVLAIKRTAISDGYGSTLGLHLFENGPRRAIRRLTAFFRSEMALGRVRSTSPLMAALHFKSLVETGLLEEALYGAKPGLKRELAVRRAVNTFLRAYGVDLAGKRPSSTKHQRITASL